MTATRPGPPEPTVEALRHPGLRLFLATRPAFLGVSFCAVLVGLGAAALDGVPARRALALATLLAALVAHAGTNVLNDYYDDLGGTDRVNVDRVFPFTGGSRFIQNGVLSAAGTRMLGLALMLATVVAGLALALASGPGLVLIGLAGVLVGWCYTAPPLKLVSRGLGEPAVALGMALIAAGTDYVQRSAFAPTPWLAVPSFALLVTAILYINQFPDFRADRATGKLNWVARLGLERARWGYPLLVAAAYLWPLAAVLAGWLPAPVLLCLLTLPGSLRATRGVLADAERPAALALPIQATIATALLHGVLLATGLFVAAGGWR